MLGTLRAPASYGRVMSGLAQETWRSIVDTLARSNVPRARRAAFLKRLRLQGGIAGCIHSARQRNVPDMRLKTVSALEGRRFPCALVEERGSDVFPKNQEFGGDMSYLFRSFSHKGDI